MPTAILSCRPPIGAISPAYLPTGPWSRRRGVPGSEPMADTRTIRVEVNGRIWSGSVETRLTLADFLRHELELTGTHVGCEHGVCGACTVLVDGTSVRACLMLAVQCEGARVATVESLAAGGELDVLQQAFRE